MPTLFFKNSTFNQFESSWNTANTSAGSSSSTQVTLPLLDTGFSASYNMYVDWGDGSTDHITTYNQAETTHTYASSGTYTIKIQGKFKGGIRFNSTGDRLKLLNISKWGCLEFVSSAAQFGGCSNLTITANDYPYMGSVTTLIQLFLSCTSLTDVPGLPSWRMGRVTSLQSMFTGCSSFNQNLNLLNVSTVTQFAGMFSGCTVYNQPMNSWNTASATGMSSFLSSCPAFNQNISNFTMTNVTNIASMLFSSTAFDQDISSWNISKVTSASNFLTSGTLSKTNYNKLLATWSAITSPQTPRTAVTINFGNSHYDSSTGGFDGTAGRAVLTGTYTWSITDGGTP